MVQSKVMALSNLTDGGGTVSNITVRNIANFFNLSVSNVTNQSEVTQKRLFDLYEAYKQEEKDQLMTYKYVAYFIGSMIIVSNLIVVVSSGLILKKGQQPKNTYLLLGNVSLADTIIGFSVIFGVLIDNSIMSSPLCIFQIGMLVCPVIVSIFSVGLIAIDRYIYILHGLYYHRWCSTIRIRIGILCTWLIGLVLGLIPVTGWTNKEFTFTRCTYMSLYPFSLMIFNATLSLIPIALVTVLYTVILVRALKNVKDIQAAKKHGVVTSGINRGFTNYSHPQNKKSLKRSLSFDSNYKLTTNHIIKTSPYKIKSIGDFTASKRDTIHTAFNSYCNKTALKGNSQYPSSVTVYTILSNCEAPVYKFKEFLDVNFPKRLEGCDKYKTLKEKLLHKDPKRLRAVAVVMLTSGSFIISWLPFFITIILYSTCENKLSNKQCLYYRSLLLGPLATLAFLNSFLNPLIYAWWHKGFKKSARMNFNKFLEKIYSINTINTLN